MSRYLCHVCYQSFDDLDVVRDGAKVTCRGCHSAPARVAAPSGSPLPRPYTYEVRTKVLTLTMPGDDKEHFAGKGTLTATPVGLQLKVKGFLSPEENLSIEWRQIRKLRNRISRDGWFSADFGRGDDLVIRVTLKSGDARALSGALDRLPDDVIGEPCPSCGALAVRGTCRACGGSVAACHRWAGLGLALGGIAIMAAGGGLTYACWSAAEPGGTFKIWAGVIAVGGFMSVLGAVKLVSGKTQMG